MLNTLRDSLRLWLAIPLALIAPCAIAQTERGTEIIERALAARADEKQGAAIYRELCTSCHGKEAHGNPDSAVPALAGQLVIYLIKQLANFGEGDRDDADMHRVIVRKQLSTPQGLSDVSTYLNHLVANQRPEFGDGLDLANGKRYYDGLCAFCHGSKAEGNEQHATPSLQRQHYSYLLAQSRQLANGHRYSVPAEVIDVLQVLPLDTLAAICDYASRLPDVSVRTSGAPDHEQHPGPTSKP